MSEGTVVCLLSIIVVVVRADNTESLMVWCKFSGSKLIQYEDSCHSCSWKTSFVKFCCCKDFTVKQMKKIILTIIIIREVWYGVIFTTLSSYSMKYGTRQRSIEHSIITNWSLFKSPNGHVMNLLSDAETWCPVRVGLYKRICLGHWLSLQVSANTSVTYDSYVA